MTFTIFGSNNINSGYESIAHFDLFDYNNDYAGNGKLFTFFRETSMGRWNGHSCGSCFTPPKYTCSYSRFDSTCASKYCGVSGFCDAPPVCPPGEYLDITYLGKTSPMLTCKMCAEGYYGNSSDLKTSSCSGKCAAGCYCPEGSTSYCQVPCLRADSFCPEGSAFPILAMSGEKTVGGNNSNEICTLNYNESRITLSPGGLLNYEYLVSRCKKTFCPQGQYCAAVPCQRGHYCTRGIEYPCPPGTFGNTTLLSTDICTGKCEVLRNKILILF